MVEWSPLWLTLKLSFLTTLILFCVAIPLANWLSKEKTIPRTFVEVIVSMPLVLPPSVIGFYLLLAFSPAGALGGMLEKWFDIRLVFSFGGLLIASIIYSLPFMVHPIQSGLASLPSSLKEAAYSLGKSERQTLFGVLLPNIKPFLFTGVILTFAHTIGEFGIVLMIGGNIPGKTRTASIAIYDEVEAFNYPAANRYALTLLTISFIMLFLLYLYNRRLARINVIQ
jgi:molybdate ABC transporter, permease protein